MCRHNGSHPPPSRSCFAHTDRAVPDNPPTVTGRNTPSGMRAFNPNSRASESQSVESRQPLSNSSHLRGSNRQPRPGCAERTAGSAVLREVRGWSPHVRGARLLGGIAGRPLLGPSQAHAGRTNWRPWARRGTIPARAGSTGQGSGVHAVYGDHPRACGEHFPELFAVRSYEGPSPRVRGALGTDFWLSHHSGTIPARAGSTPRVGPVTSLRRDHLRACGEHVALVGTGVNQPGPSPRMRGAPVTRDVVHDLHGTIPARAGSTGDWS